MKIKPTSTCHGASCAYGIHHPASGLSKRKPGLTSLLAAILVCACSTALAECLQWHRVFPLNYPGKRYSHAMAYDSERGVVVFFGGEYSEPGSTTSTFYNDTWEYDGTNWKRIEFPENMPLPSPRSGHTLAYDAARTNIVLFGGVDGSRYYDDTWVYTSDGSTGRWTQLFRSGPSQRAGHTMVYDATRRRVILHGGLWVEKRPLRDLHHDNAETWEWDGTYWTQSTSGAGSRVRAAAVYDSVRSVMILFGGVQYRLSTGIPAVVLTPLQEGTWEYADSIWRLASSGTPPLRQEHAMAYFEALGKVILFGGHGDVDGIGDDTDVYTPGVGWSSLFASGPEPRGRHAMVYDSRRRRIVLYGGVSGDTRYDDTYELVTVGPTFSQQPTSRAIYPCETVTFSAAVVGDPPHEYRWQKLTEDRLDAVDVQDGFGVSGATTTTLTLANVRVNYEGIYQLVVRSPCGTNTSNGARLRINGKWFQYTPEFKPDGRYNAAAAYDGGRGVTVVFGGVRLNPLIGGYYSRETFEWNGDTWRLAALAGPTPRTGAAMTYDRDRRVVVLFGGHDAGGGTRDTWAYDGAVWRLLATNGPSPRGYAALAYDSLAHRTILYGGSDASGNYQYDTWEFDAASSTWRQVPTGWPDGTLLSRRTPAMAFDERRGKRVLVDYVYNGNDIHELRVFEWDGAAWVRQMPSPDYDLPDPRIPTPVYDFGIAYDTQRGMVVISNGRNPGAYPHETWGYDGRKWSLLTVGGPGPLSNGALAYDSARHALVEFGGWRNDVGGYWDQTWELVRADYAYFPSLPVTVRTEPNGATEISLPVQGLPPYTFRWLSNSVPIADGDLYRGTTGNTLHIDRQVNGLYTIEATAACGGAVGTSILLPTEGTAPISLGGTRLTVSNAPTGPLLLWPDATAELHSAPTPTGGWARVTGASRPFPLRTAEPARFYRLQGGTGCANMPPGLVSAWRGEGDAADDAAKNSGALWGGLGFAAGQVGQAFYFTNDGQGIAIEESPSLNVGTNDGFTVEAWINPSDVDHPRPIVEWFGGPWFSVGAQFWLGASLGGVGGPGCLYGALDGSGNPAVTALSVPGLLRSNTWQHVAMVYQARDPVFGSLRLYLNGQLVAVEFLGSPSPVAVTDYRLYLGIRPGRYYYRGLMDEVALYRQALDAETLQMIYRADAAGKCTLN